MPRSYPDWSNVRREVVYILREDLGELAVRLGAISSLDRRGTVVLADDFSHGLGAWTVGLTGAGDVVELSTANPYVGAFCVKVLTEATASGGAGLYRYLPYPEVGKLGLEAAFRPVQNCDEIFLGYTVYDGAQEYDFACRITLADEELLVLAPGDIWVKVADTPDLMFDPYPYFRIKLVGNVSAETYIRVILNSTTYDISTQSVYTAVSVNPPYAYLILWVYQDWDTAAECYLDTVIFTQDES